MKVIVITTLSLLVAFFGNKSKAQTLSGDFENWDSVSTEMFTDYLPNGWGAFLNQFCEEEGKPWSVTPTTDANSGTRAIQLKNIATSFSQAATLMTGGYTPENGFVNKVPVDKRYTRLEGYYKYATTLPDTFSIMAFMFKGEDIIATGELRKSANTSTYTKFSMPIVYFGGAAITPDSVAIVIYAGSIENVKEGTTLILDDIAFAPVNTGILEQAELKANVSVYPNPSSELLTVSVQQATHGDVTIELVNMVGQVLKTQKVSPAGNNVETSFTLLDMPKGLLFVRVADDSGAKGYRIVHQ